MGDVKGGADGVLLASGSSLSMRTLAATEAGYAMASCAMLSNTVNISTAHLSSYSVVSVSASVNCARFKVNACAELASCHLGITDKLKKETFAFRKTD